MQSRKSNIIWLALGDMLVILALAIIGYLTHYASREPFGFRWLSTFIPLCLGWVLAAVPSGLYQPSVYGDWKQVLWRGGVAGVLAAPFAALLRGLYLSAAIAPVFMLVLSAFSALGMGAWRAIWAILAAKRYRHG